MIAGYTVYFKKEEVILAGGATALVTLALTIYAIRAKRNLQIVGAIINVLFLALIPIWFIGFILEIKQSYII